MTEQPEQTTAELTEEHLQSFLDTLSKRKIKQVYGTNLDESEAHTITAKLQGTAAYISARSNQRQEQILTEQKTVLDRMESQSKTMRWHSWGMFILTAVILFAMGIQIYIALNPPVHTCP